MARTKCLWRTTLQIYLNSNFAFHLCHVRSVRLVPDFGLSVRLHANDGDALSIYIRRCVYIISAMRLSNQLFTVGYRSPANDKNDVRAHHCPCKLIPLIKSTRRTFPTASVDFHKTLAILTDIMRLAYEVFAHAGHSFKIVFH